MGGEVTYRHIGGTRYEITIDLYQDCLGGAEKDKVISEDNPAFLAVYFTGSTSPFINFDTIRVGPAASIDVPANFSNSCINQAPTVCLKRQRFRKEYNFPPSATGYTIVYQRCCRNNTIVNIINPGNTGATYYCIIPPVGTAPANNSAVFKNYPPQIICANVPLVYDHSAVDPDGDSLSYEFCLAYQGGSVSDVKPEPPSPPPFIPVNYSPPFTFANPMGGFPKISINPKTGIITGTPTSQNRYVVTVCCHEWRNGLKINTTSREFQFVVTNCSKAVVANTPLFSEFPETYIVNCRDYTVNFKNTSTGGFEWYWELGVNGATSTEFEPTFTYPDTGTYFIKLFVNRGSTCPDSIERIVKIYPTFTGDYSVAGLLCPNTPIQFADLSTSTFGPVSFWAWDFGDAQTATDANPTHSYAQGSDYNVTLISGNERGCRDTTVKSLGVEKFKPFAGNDTVIVKGEYINFNAEGGITYLWTPDTLLNNPNVNDPTGRFYEEGYYPYNVHITSMNNCEGDDSIIVRVVGKESYFVPNAFTPNGDGMNDVFRPRAVGYRSVEYFSVFNRFGQMVYESKDFAQGWDGTFNGNQADMGTYMYMLKMIDRFGKPVNVKGDVILMR